MSASRPILLTSLVAFVAAVAAPAGATTITPDLRDALVRAGPDDLVPVVVMMESFPRQDEIMAEVRGLNRRAARAHVISRMRGLAGRSQKRVRAILQQAGDEALDVRVLWGINGVSVRATPAVIDRLSSLEEIRWLKYDGGSGRPATRWTDPVPITTDQGLTLRPDLTGPTGGDASGPNPNATIRGEVTAMGAPQVWDELGYTGVGVIVAVIDTGVDPTHPDIADHIWTNLDEVPTNGIDDDRNGFIDDTWGWDLCDDDNVPDSGAHGTQVAGQVAGDGTDGIVTGMAPDAEIMVIGINCSPPDSIGWAASDYAIQNGAHIITESYIWPWTDPPDFEGWRRQTDTELAAGVIHINAAGNDGEDPDFPVPYQVSAPGNSPPPWLHPDQTLVGGLSSTVTVANINWFDDNIAPSSSRGPSAWEDIRTHTNPDWPFAIPPEYQDYPYENGAQMGLLKPDIAAYGNGTTSICPGGSYCSFSGTSSATPHVTGVVALMLQANPELTPAEITEALLTTAQHRGDPGKNNVYGTGLVQAYPAVDAVETGVLYLSHVFDDTTRGNGDLAPDPGETVTVEITVRSVTDDATVEGLEAILTSPTPGVTIHDGHATYPSVPALGTATSDAPHYTFSLAPDTCSTVATFDLELRFDGKVRRSTFDVRVGDETFIDLLYDDFEADLGWSSDPGTSTTGAWVREDPIGVVDGAGNPSNPEDDTSVAGVTCWVTGNGELNGKKDEHNNDVDDGVVTLTSPPFGSQHMLTLELTYDRWYYDLTGTAGDSFKAEVSDDGGVTWTLIEQLYTSPGGWSTQSVNLFPLITVTDDMRLRFSASDGVDDSAVEAAIDEVRVGGVWVDCQAYDPGIVLPPNPVGDTLSVGADPGGHTVLSWIAPPIDAGHDPATLYHIERATSPDGAFVEVGTAITTTWTDVDALSAADSYYYRVWAE